MNRTLLVTNDFPPRPGGIQSFLHGLVSRLPPEEVVVYAPAWRGAATFDAQAPFRVVRHPTSLMLPVPSVLRRARELITAHNCSTIWFGAAAPLGLLGSALRTDGVRRVVATTHGHEVGWALLPGARQALRRIGDATDVVTYLGDYTGSRLAPALGPHPELVRLAPGVDPTVFRPDADGAVVRRRLGLSSDQPVVVCVSRLMPRKGQDVLIRSLPELRRRVPGTALLLVGGGPARARLARLARALDVDRYVVFTGSVPGEWLPAHYAAGDVFAMPCRTRLGGADVEGLGIVYLEASASGLPVVAGRSGGAPDAVLDGETGQVVDGRSVAAVTAAVAGLLSDPGRGRQLGDRGRGWVTEHWRPEVVADRLRSCLDGCS